MTERELLAIVETLKEFCNIPLGQKIRVFTDHKNITYKAFNTDRVMCWRLIIEEYGPDLEYIKGTHNTIADALSRLGIKKTTTIQHRTKCRIFRYYQTRTSIILSIYLSYFGKRTTIGGPRGGAKVGGRGTEETKLTIFLPSYGGYGGLLGVGCSG